jgi:predicted ATP-grasp superfamily ATP-dependent carboligase
MAYREWRVLVHEWVTGGGLAGSPLESSWAAEGRAMRQALAADFAANPLETTRVTITLDRRLREERGPWTVVRVGDGKEEETLARLAAEADFTVLIAPESGGILASRARLVARSGSRSLGSSPEAIEATADKLRLGAHLASLGIATPPCLRVVPADGLPDAFPYPAVLKPIDGCGSVDTYHIPEPGRCPEGARALPEALLQPRVPGVPMSASFLVDGQGCARLVGVGRQRFALQGDRYVYRGGTLPVARSLADGDPRRAAETVPGLRGFVGVDFVWDEAAGRATVLEINPRPTTSCVALTRLLPPGKLAESWFIDAIFRSKPGGPGELAEIVHAQPPLTFDADGTIRREGGGLLA